MRNTSVKRVLLASGLVVALFAMTLLVLDRRANRDLEHVANSPQVASRVLMTAVRMRQAQKPGCPTVLELRDEHFLDPGFALDQWQSPYVIECAPDAITVRSLGPDGKTGTADDVIVKASK